MKVFTFEFFLSLLHTAIECDELESLENGVITYGPDRTAPYSLGTIANHTCNPGFILVGDPMRMCIEVDENGEFDREPPTCIRKKYVKIINLTE